MADITTIGAVDDQHVLLADDRLHVLNPTAHLIVQHWLDGRSESSCAETLVRLFGIALEQAQADVAATLNQWRRDTQAQEVSPFPPPHDPRVNRAPPYIHNVSEKHYCLGALPWKLRHEGDIHQSLFDLLAHLERPVAQTLHASSTFSLRIENAAYELWRGASPIGTKSSFDDVILTLLFELGEWCYRQHDWRIVLHAAGVRVADKAIVMPASGGTGKTTLTAALLAAGFGYLSDDLVPLISDKLHALPVPLPLRIKAGSVSLLTSYYPELGKLPLHGPASYGVRLLRPQGYTLEHQQRNCRVAALVFPEREAGETILEPIPPVDALRRILDTGALFHRPLIPEHVVSVLDWLSSVPSYRLRYTGLQPAVEKLLCLT